MRTIRNLAGVSAVTVAKRMIEMGAVMLIAGAATLGCATPGPDGSGTDNGEVKVTTQLVAADGTVQVHTETWNAEKLVAMVAQKEALAKAAASGGAATLDGTYAANSISCTGADTWIFDGDTVGASVGMICLKNGGDDNLSNYTDGWGIDHISWMWAASMVWPGTYNGFFDCTTSGGTFIGRNYFSAWSGQQHIQCGDSPVFGRTTWVRSTLNSCSSSGCVP